MYKIESSKQYYNVVTDNGTTTVEIPTVKGGNGATMNQSEVLTELCRAVIKIEDDEVCVARSVYRVDGGNHTSIDVKVLPEYVEAVKHPESEVIETVLTSCWDSGAALEIPCMVNTKTREVFGLTLKAHPCDDDGFAHATVDVFGEGIPLVNVDYVLDEYDADDALEELYWIQAAGDYWESTSGKTLTGAIHECRWHILKDALMQRGRDAVTDFIGTDIKSSEFSRVLDETETKMSDDVFEKFWEKYI